MHIILDWMISIFIVFILYYFDIVERIYNIYNKCKENYVYYYINQNKNNKMNLVGLTNLGNTCYLNTCIQLLKNTHELNDILNNKIEFSRYNQNIPDKNVLIEWNKLQHQLCNDTNKSIRPADFVNCIRKNAAIKKRVLFTGISQNDMPEFLQFFIECIHTSISRPVDILIEGTPKTEMDITANECYRMLQTTYRKEYSEVFDIFYGIYVSEIISLNTNQRCSITPEQFFILDLPIVYENMGATTLYDCFDFFIKPDKLIGDNAWFNEKKGKKEDILKRNIFWSFPQFLVITLNRFSIDGSHKINTLIDIPINDLDLSKYVNGYDAYKYKYDLVGIGNHMGNINGGHYTAFVKNPYNRWASYDDDIVYPIPDISSIISPAAYCLFYRIKNNGL